MAGQTGPARSLEPARRSVIWPPGQLDEWRTLAPSLSPDHQQARHASGMRVLPTDPVREQGSRRDRLLLTLATAASTAAALASAILISWALQTIAAGAIFGAVILGASAVAFAAARGRTAARVQAAAIDWTIARVPLDAIDQAAAVYGGDGRLILVHPALCELGAGYRARRHVVAGKSGV